THILQSVKGESRHTMPERPLDDGRPVHSLDTSNVQRAPVASAASSAQRHTKQAKFYRQMHTSSRSIRLTRCSEVLPPSRLRQRQIAPVEPASLGWRRRQMKPGDALV